MDGCEPPGDLWPSLCPGAPEEVIGLLEENIQGMGPVTAVLDRGRAGGDPPAGIPGAGLSYHRPDAGGVPVLLQPGPGRTGGAQPVPGRLGGDGAGRPSPLKVRCQFCDAVYNFSLSEMAAWIREKEPGQEE